MTGSWNGRVVSGTPRDSRDADATDGLRPLVVRDYERTVRHAEEEAEKARARLAAVVAALR